MASIRNNLQDFFNEANDMSTEELLERANLIVDNQGFWAALGNVAPISAAENSINRLEDALTYGDARAIENGQEADETIVERETNTVRGLLSGAAQPTTFGNFYDAADNSWNELLSEMTRVQENIANTTDFSALTEAEAQEILDSDLYQEQNQQLQELQSFFTNNAELVEATGLETPTFTLEQDAQGNFVNSFYEGQEPEVTAEAATNRGVLVRDNGNGSFDIYYADNGDVIETYEGTMGQALARQQQIVGGGTPTVTGRPDLFVIDPLPSETVESFVQDGVTVEPRTATTEELTALDAGTLESFNVTHGIEEPVAEDTGGLPDTIDTSGLSDEAVGDLTALWTGLLDSEVGMELLTQALLSEEDVANILAQAQEHITGSGSYYEQTFERALEAFNISTGYAAEQRELALAQEGLENTVAREQAAASAAEAGLAFSGIRELSSARLEEQIENVAESGSLEFEQQMQQLGFQAESYLGSEALGGATIPSVSGQSIFTPTGGVTGSLEEQAEIDVGVTAAQLRTEEVISRLSALPEAQAVVEDLTNQL